MSNSKKSIISKKLSRFFTERKFNSEYKNFSPQAKKFNDFIKNSIDFIFLMPTDEKTFAEAIIIPTYIKIHKKNTTLILPEYFINSISNKNGYTFISYFPQTFEKLGYATDDFLSVVSEKRYDVFFDLTPEENLFTSSLSLKINADFKIALFKKEKTKIYNMLFNEEPINILEKSFENLLNSIRMF